MIIFLPISSHSRGAARDRHLSRGGMRWTRQRQARTMRGWGSLFSSGFYGPVHPNRWRPRCADSAKVGPVSRSEYAPLKMAAFSAANRKSTSPENASRAGPSRVVLMPAAGIKGWRACCPTGTQDALSPDGDKPSDTSPGRARSKPEAHRARNAGRFRCNRGD